MPWIRSPRTGSIPSGGLVHASHPVVLLCGLGVVLAYHIAAESPPDGVPGCRFRLIAEFEEPVRSFKISPDASRIAAPLPGRLAIVPGAVGGPTVVLGRDEGGLCQSLDWSPDGSVLASCDRMQGPVLTWKVDGDRPPAPLGCVRGGLVAYLPDGTLVVACDDRTLAQVDPRSATVLRRQPIPWRPSRMRVSPDGSLVAVVAHPSEARGSFGIWEVSDGRVRIRPDAHGYAVSALAFDRLGRTLVSSGMDHRVARWDVDSLESPLAETRLDAPAFSLCVLPDSRAVVSGDVEGRITVLDLETLDPLRSLRAHSRTVTALQTSPDSLSLVSSSLDGTLRSWPIHPLIR